MVARGIGGADVGAHDHVVTEPAAITIMRTGRRVASSALVGSVVPASSSAVSAALRGSDAK